jgi:hypothetical protein
MNKRAQELCLWSGPLFMLVFLIGFWFVAGLVPPPSPHDSALKIAHLYQQNTNQIRAGLLLTMIGTALSLPFVSLISIQMKRIEGRFSVLSYTQLVSGATTCLLITFPLMIMTAAAFRPGRDPQLILLLNDVAWIPFVMVFPPIVVECLSIAVAVLGDKAAKPVFPRWVAYYNLWTAFLFLPAGLLTFFKHGPFAWNGLLAFWMALAVFGAWFIVMFVVLRQAINQQYEERLAAAVAEGTRPGATAVAQPA